MRDDPNDHEPRRFALRDQQPRRFALRDQAILVTGGAGFIGSHLVRLLVREQQKVAVLVRPGADLRRLDDVRPRVTLVEADLLDAGALEDTLRGRPPALCFHLAWFIAPGIHPDSPRNIEFVTASMNLLRALDAVGCARTVITGTCLEQDTAFGHLSEQTPIRPQNFYAACKHALHVMAEQFQRHRGRSFAWARLFNVYGPGEYAGPLVPHVISTLLADRSCALTKGQQLRDYLHVEDVAVALWAIGRSRLEGAVNIGSSEPVAVATVAEKLGALLGRAHLLRFGERAPTPFDCALLCAEAGRLRAEAGWSPRIGLDDGLAATVRWWKERSGGQKAEGQGA